MYDKNKLVEEPEETSEELEGREKKPSKAEFYIELALFLILGLLIGIAVKTESVKRIAIGYEDYKMNIYQSDYNINTMQVEVAKKRAEELKKQQEAQAQAQNAQSNQVPAESADQTQEN